MNKPLANVGLLIDENLSLSLVKLAARRGMRAIHVNNVRLRTCDDKHVARYAIEHGLIVVTRNWVDFQAIYSGRLLHPGLVFLISDRDVSFKRHDQVSLFGAALDQIEVSEPIQEAIALHFHGRSIGGIDYSVVRYQLPPH